MDEGSITRVVDGRRETEPGRPDTAPLPEVVGRDRIVSRLGRGGGGVVDAAHDPKLDRTVAVKLLHAGARASEADRARLLREAQALAQISDANVVTPRSRTRCRIWSRRWIGAGTSKARSRSRSGSVRSI